MIAEVGNGQMNETIIVGRLARAQSGTAASQMAAIGGWLQRCYARAKQRRDLAELDPRLQSDIGVTQVDVMTESAKPFWR